MNYDSHTRLMALSGHDDGRLGEGTNLSNQVRPFRMIGSVVGPIFAGYIFDVYDDYRFAFNVFSVFALLSIRGPSS